MGLISSIKGWFGGRAPKAPAFDWRAANRELRARYDSALTSDETSRRWGQIDYLSARSANNYQVRRILRMKSRYAIANNCFARGLLETKVRNLIGTGPRPRFRTGDKEADKLIKRRWDEYTEEIGFHEKLMTTATAKMASGEGVLLQKNNPRQSSVQLYLQDIECDQVTSLTPATLDQYFLDGVVVDDLNIPVSYAIMRSHPGDYLFPDMNPWQTDQVRADKVIFWFKKDRPSQIRGIPEMTPALDLFEHMREYRINELTTKALQACYTVYFKNVMGTGVGGWDLKQANADPMTAVNIERGMATELPAGYEPVQLDPRESSTDFKVFIYMLMAEASRCVRVPLNLALGTSQEFNFASARMDFLEFRDDLAIERVQCNRIVCNPIVRAWLDEGVNVPGYFPDGFTPEMVSVRWFWPGWSWMDPLKDAKADTERLAAKSMTYEEYWAAQGRDYEEEFEQCGREQEMATELGFELAKSKGAGSTGDQVGEALDERQTA